ncbi:hypothetical protein OG785_45500 [Streptomyces sp. NBC_00006]|uniref:hypothetical protein n=1 Tax=Streptomyces sp. NBC_00006 TaxID=2975619 RepID=UPI00225480E5|nr:hypothetical protein [Streptomyces sp. NBC_00006]MCX5537816.1 hypothetical protein [Streptomyces sp. NBC_00006]
MKNFTVTLTDGTEISGGDEEGPGDAYSMNTDSNGVTIHWYCDDRTELHPWHRVAKVAWTGA